MSQVNARENVPNQNYMYNLSESKRDKTFPCKISANDILSSGYPELNKLYLDMQVGSKHVPPNILYEERQT